MTQLEFELGLDVIRSYRRLSYTPWHALAEFVDNSTQSFFNNRAVLEQAFAEEHDRLEVSIIYDKEAGLIRIADNAMGMSRDELRYALHVGARPAIDSGRSQFGMGMKTAASWLGSSWSIRTKKLGDTVEFHVSVDVERIASGDPALPLVETDQLPPSDHHTVIEIRELNRTPQGRTLGKIREFLASMYRQDFRHGDLVLTWQGQELSWEESDDWFLVARDGTPYKKPFSFMVEGKDVTGWVGVLAKGGRAKAGFSILHRGRVVRGWPDSWRPERIFGQLLGSNDLVNQRIIGEIALDEFEISHTKDDILWLGDEEDLVQKQLEFICADYVSIAKKHRKGVDERGPSDVEIRTAVQEFEHELSSDEMADVITLEQVPAPEVVRQALRPLLESVDLTDPTFDAFAGDFQILGFLATDESSNDPYVVVDSTSDDRVLVIINMVHPHVSQIVGSEGMLNYLRHCTYDAIAEWQARHKVGTIDSDTVKLLKDRLLRVPLQMEMREEREAQLGDEAV